MTLATWLPTSIAYKIIQINCDSYAFIQSERFYRDL